jgi:vacuolar-type H+-ATPase subunit I/STV1
MAAQPDQASPTLERALDDLKQIRETLDRGRESHPIRLIGRALMTMSAVIGALIVLYGVVAQLLLSAFPEGVGGLSASAIVWMMSAVMLLASAAAKVTISSAASREAGFDTDRLLRSVMTTDYLRVLVPLYFLTAVAGIGLAGSGRTDMLPGLITVAYGAALVSIPVFLPLGELTVMGGVSLVLGCAAMFAFPEWPFLKVALVLGLPMMIGALAGRRSFPEVGGG